MLTIVLTILGYMLILAAVGAYILIKEVIKDLKEQNSSDY